jgi:hypothetical protein
MTMNLHTRLKCIIDSYTHETVRYKMLEDATSIPAATWRTYYTRGVRPTADLIEAAAKAWPKHAFWLVTGVQDDQFGHTAPVGNGFPQTVYLDGDEPSKVYFENQIKASNWLKDNNESFENTIENLEGSEGKVPSITDNHANKKLTKNNFLASIEAAQSIRKIEIFIAVFAKELAQNELETRLPSLINELEIAEKNALNQKVKIAVEPIKYKLNELLQWQKKYIEWTKFKSKVGLI